jgi:hypothetical protein
MTSDDSPASRGDVAVASTRIREILFAHLVLSLADLRLRKRVQQRARRTVSTA